MSTDLLYYLSEPPAQTVGLGGGVSGAIGGAIRCSLSSEDRPTGLQVKVFRDDLRHPHHVIAPNVAGRAGSFGRKWQTRLNDRGSGTLTVLNDGPDRDEIATDDLIRLELDGNTVASFVVDTLDSSTIPAATPTGQPPASTVVAGAGPLGYLAYGAVLPSLGWDRKPVQFDRAFGPFDPAFPDDAWPSAVAYGTYGDAGLTYWQDVLGNPWPTGWPAWSPAQWAGPPSGTADNAAPGHRWVRKWITLYDDADYMVYFSCDNLGELYWDGFQAVTSKGFQDTSQSDTIGADAGDHLIGIHVWNAPDDGPAGGNPCGYIFEVWRMEGANPVERVAWSDGTELLVESEHPPGMNDGEVLIALLTGAQGEGWLTDLEWTFDAHTDSAGVPWGPPGERTVKVGQDLATVICDEFAATFIDVRMWDGAMVLDAYALDGMGVALDVDLHAATDRSDPSSGNLTELSHTRKAVTASHLMAQYQGGWRKVTAPDFTGRGRVKALGLGSYQSDWEVDVVGLKELERYARVREAVVAGVLPEVLIDAGARVGDTLSVPGYDGTPSVERIIGLTWAEDANGLLSVTPELKDLLLQQSERHEQWLNKMAKGAVDGTSGVAQPIALPDTAGPTCCPMEPVVGGG